MLDNSSFFSLSMFFEGQYIKLNISYIIGVRRKSRDSHVINYVNHCITVMYAARIIGFNTFTGHGHS